VLSAPGYPATRGQRYFRTGDLGMIVKPGGTPWIDGSKGKPGGTPGIDGSKDRHPRDLFCLWLYKMTDGHEAVGCTPQFTSIGMLFN
jgi:hypothetical protein